MLDVSASVSCFLEMLEALRNIGGPTKCWTLPQNQNISLKTPEKGLLNCFN